LEFDETTGIVTPATSAVFAGAVEREDQMKEAADAPMRKLETDPSRVRAGRVVVNLDERVVSVDDQPVRLSGKEYEILELLSLRKGTILSKEMILDRLYAGVNEPELKIIDIFVCKLRKKIAQATGGIHHIETVWGRGYVLRDTAVNSEIHSG
jgi:DNA-binding response OmpR family regulator